MKRILFCLALLAAFALSACGTQTEAPENTAVPMDGDEAPQYDPSNPLANYLDHSNLDDETLSRLKAACGTAGTKAKAADLINRRAMSRSDLEKKLREKGAGEGDIRYAAEWLEAIGALNDQDFAAMLARSCAQRFYGPARFREELRRHGVDRALWEEAEALLPPEEELIESYLRAKVRTPPTDNRERKRLSDSLARWGFSWPAVRTVLRRFGADWADDP